MENTIRLVRVFRNRKRAKDAVVALYRHPDITAYPRIYVQDNLVWVDVTVPGSLKDWAQGVFAHADEGTDPPPVYLCQEFYQGEGITKFQPSYGKARRLR